MPPTENIAVTDDQYLLLQAIAHERGITVDEAATQLQREAFAALVRKGTGRVPARVYPPVGPKQGVH